MSNDSKSVTWREKRRYCNQILMSEKAKKQERKKEGNLCEKVEIVLFEKSFKATGLEYGKWGWVAGQKAAKSGHQVEECRTCLSWTANYVQ